MTIGAVVLGLVFGLMFYVLTRWAMVAFHEQRRRRLAAKARGRARATAAGAGRAAT
jgi:uncharacterized protein (DUF2062 family)